MEQTWQYLAIGIGWSVGGDSLHKFSTFENDNFYNKIENDSGRTKMILSKQVSLALIKYLIEVYKSWNVGFSSLKILKAEKKF